jgi:hypothetical protein
MKNIKNCRVYKSVNEYNPLPHAALYNFFIAAGATQQRNYKELLRSG